MAWWHLPEVRFRLWLRAQAAYEAAFVRYHECV